jgi:DnaA-homolog protein
MKQIPLPIVPAPQPSFDNFIVGANHDADHDANNSASLGANHGANASALQHLRELPLPSAPVYLWGPAGSGKTHLLQSLAARCQAAGRLVGWFNAADSLPWTLSPDWAVLVIDGADTLSADAQHAAFAMFEDATAHGVQVAAAGRVPPVDLPLRDDLRTRLAWGHVFALQALSDADTRAALRREADHRGSFLPDDVLDHLLLHFPRDLSHLMQVVLRLDDYGLAKARRLTVPLLREMLNEERDPQGVSNPEVLSR